MGNEQLKSAYLATKEKRYRIGESIDALEKQKRALKRQVAETEKEIRRLKKQLSKANGEPFYKRLFI